MKVTVLERGMGPHMRTLLAVALVSLVALTNCGPAPVMPRDLRVQVPAVDPGFLDFVTNEQVIGPGEDKMFCSELEYDGADTAFTEVESLQGKFGHHVILVSTTKPRGKGSNYDCTEMTDFLPLAIPANGWPAGHGSSLPKGTPVVVQMHYVNTGTQPILVRDIVRLKRMDPAQVTTWVSPFALNHEGFTVPPHGEQTVTFDCTMTKPYKLLLVGGHMHENGTRFKVEWSPGGAGMSTLYDVPMWKASYRDEPPVNLYLSEMKDVPANTVFRTSCSWLNETDKPLAYPHEMCATFGLFAGTKEPLVCRKAQ